MGEQFVPNITVKGQIKKLPEDLQFQAVQRTLELMLNKKLLREHIAKLEKDLKEMHFVFHETPMLSFKSKKQFVDESPYVSQSGEEFLARVFRKTVCKGVFFMILLMVMKFAAVSMHLDVLEEMDAFVSGHFFLTAAIILAGCVMLSMAEIVQRDKTNAAEIKRINRETAIYNKDVDKQNKERSQKNLQAKEDDKVRRAKEEKVYQTKRDELKKLLNACKTADKKTIDDLEEMQNRNVLPGIFFVDGNRVLPMVYDLMQTRVVTKLYDLDGALEKVRSMILEEEKMNRIQEIVNNTAQTVGELKSLNCGIQGVHYKLDSLDSQMSSLVLSQERMNAALADARQSNQEVVAAIERQSNNLTAQNKVLASSIDKSIRDNSLGQYFYDASLFGTHINAKNLKKLVEG